MNVTSTIERLFVPDVPHQQRHATIFARFDALPVGGAFEILNDHDPVPLHMQFDQVRNGQFNWEYIKRGPEEFLVRIGRIRAGTAAGAATNCGDDSTSGCGCSGG